MGDEDDGSPDATERSHPVALAGVLILVNGCEALDVYYGLDGPTEILLNWTEPANRVDWLQARFDGYLTRWGADEWQAWLDVGGGLTQSTRGMAMHVYPADRTERCGGLELPVFDVVAVQPWDVETASPVSDAIIPRGLPFDPRDPAVAELLRARRDGREMTIRVRRTTDPSLGWPPWMLVAVGDIRNRHDGNYGFVELRFERPELRASTRVSGYLTGEITRFRDTEAVYLTPVFIVTGGVETPGEPFSSD